VGVALSFSFYRPNFGRSQQGAKAWVTTFSGQAVFPEILLICAPGSIWHSLRLKFGRSEKLLLNVVFDAFVRDIIKRFQYSFENNFCPGCKSILLQL
jgi:hypothetical protein